MARKFSAFTNNPSRVPLDTLVGLDISAAAAAQNSYWSLNTLFSEITGNITDGALRFGGFAAPAVSAAGKAALYFDSTSNTLKLSNNAGAYADVRSGTVTVPQGGTGLTTLTAYALMAAGTTATGNMQQVSGVGTSGQVLTSNGAGALPTWQAAAGTIGGSIANTQVAVGSGANTIAGSSALTFASGGLSITGTTNPGIAITGTAATESGVTVFQSVSGTAADAFLHFQSPSTDMLFRLTTAGFTPTGLVKANQIDLLGATGTVEMLFRLADASTRFVFGVNDVEAASINATSTESLVLGVASSLTGRVRMYNSAGATYSQISAGNAGSSLNFIWPIVNPTVGQVLSASAPSGSDVTLSWVSAAAVTSLTATQVGFGDGTNMLSGSADFTYATATGVLDVTKTGVNSSVRMTVTNASAGTAAQARFGASSDSAGASLAAYSSTFTTAGLITANTALLDLDSPTALIAARAAGALIFGMGTTTERARLTDTTFLLSVDPTTGSGLNVASATVTSGNLARIAMTGTAAAANTKTALAITSSGANGTASQTVTGASISVTNTGTTNTNVALTLTASGAATANTALNVTAGQVILPAGTVSLPSITPAADNTSGIYWTTTTNLSLSVSGTERYRFGSAGLLSLTDGVAAGTSIGGVDCHFRRAGAANWRLGASDAAAPVAQTLSVQNVVTGTADTAGANWTRIGSRGTGTGAGGSHIWQVAPAAGSSSTQNTLINGLVLTSTGQLYGSALHNNSAAVTGTTNQYIASGTYTPTVTAVANCTATSSGVCNWIRVGNVVTASGTVAIDPTSATTFTSVGISLPIASNFVTDPSECAGVAACANVAGYAGAIVSDTTNDRAQLNFTTVTDVANQPWSFTFTYVVL